MAASLGNDGSILVDPFTRGPNPSRPSTRSLKMEVDIDSAGTLLWLSNPALALEATVADACAAEDACEVSVRRVPATCLLRATAL